MLAETIVEELEKEINMKVIYNNIIPFKGYIAINLFGFIFVRSSYKKYEGTHKYQSLINHERIHTAQMKETLFILFYIIYGLEYLIKLCYYFDFHKTYKNVSFEREAFSNQTNLDYLQVRKFFRWCTYIYK